MPYFTCYTYLYTKLDAIKRAQSKKRSQQILSNFVPFPNATYFHPCKDVCLQYVWKGFMTESELVSVESNSGICDSEVFCLTFLFLSRFVSVVIPRVLLDRLSDSEDL